MYARQFLETDELLRDDDVIGIDQSINQSVD